MPEAVPQRQSISRQPGFWSRFRRLAIVRILLGSVFVVATVAIIQIGSGFAARNPNIKYFFAVTRLPALVVVVAVLLVYCGFFRWFEKRAVSELHARSALPGLVTGVALGATMFALTIGVLSLLGVYRVVGVDSWTVLWPISWQQRWPPSRKKFSFVESSSGSRKNRWAAGFPSLFPLCYSVPPICWIRMPICKQAWQSLLKPEFFWRLPTW